MCEYCENKKNILFSWEPETERIEMFIDKNSLVVNTGDLLRAITMSYCPMCGRELVESELTREDVREAFVKCLTYELVEPNDIHALSGYLKIEYARHNLNSGNKDLFPFYNSDSPPVINPAEGGGIESAYLCVSASCFRDREAVSFNSDGFIGLAGWASDHNVQPFLRAFMRWLTDYMISGDRAKAAMMSLKKNRPSD